jgi:hypothetical protein
MESKLREYVQVAREVWDTFGLATMLVATAIAAWFGWINSPFSEARDMLGTHITTMERHISHDDEVLFYLKSLCLTNAELAKVSPSKCTWDPR